LNQFKKKKRQQELKKRKAIKNGLWPQKMWMKSCRVSSVNPICFGFRPFSLRGKKRRWIRKQKSFTINF